MANTYTGIFVHLVFAAKYREAAIVSVYRERIYQYMKQIIRELGHVPLAIGGTDNHVHILVGYNVNCLLPDLVKTLKSHTTKFINSELVLSRRFEWQRGYAALSNSRKEIEAVKSYIARQPEHHLGMSLNDEVRLMLDRCGIPYDGRYLFDED